MDWTRLSAKAFLCQHQDLLAGQGFAVFIVGSVATKGQSDKDIDLVLKPLAESGGITMEEAINRINDHIRTEISEEKDLNLLPCPNYNGEGDKTETWFVNIELFDKRIVEFYLSTRYFPFADESPQMK